jgi:hypothetical protein
MPVGGPNPTPIDMTDAPEYLRAGEIARLSGASVRTVRRWIADEILRRLSSAVQKTGGDPRVYLARTQTACPIVVLLGHARVGMVQ